MDINDKFNENCLRMGLQSAMITLATLSCISELDKRLFDDGKHTEITRDNLHTPDDDVYNNHSEV